MLCSSLRKRKKWAQIIPSLSGTAHSGWSESQLGTHDVAFETTSKDGKDALFRAILLTAAEVQLPQTKDRIERLYMLDGGQNVAVVLLIAEERDIDSYVQLQIEMLRAKSTMPIIPIMSTSEIPRCFDELRRQRNTKSIVQSGIDKQLPERELVSRCVPGPPLGERQTNIITGIAPSLGELARRACDPEGQSQLCGLLGQDGARVVSFFNPDDLASFTSNSLN